jgi:hypothetical protein
VTYWQSSLERRSERKRKGGPQKCIREDRVVTQLFLLLYPLPSPSQYSLPPAAR